MGGSPLVVFELDACDEGLLDRFAAEGAMPNLAALQRDGIRRRIGGGHLLSELGSWSTIWSGKPTAEHGYYFYRSLRPGTYDLGSMGPADAKTDAFWARLPKGHKALVVDLSEALPDHRVDGSQIAYWRCVTSKIYKMNPMSLPEPAVGELIRKYGPSSCITPFPMPASFEEARPLFEDYRQSLRRKTDAILDMIKRQRHDFIGIGFSEMHVAAHCFWDYGPDRIKEMYTEVDFQMGRIIEALPDSATIVALSVYGIKPEYPTTDIPEAVLRKLGYQAAPASGRRGGLSRVKDLIPLHWRVEIGKRLSVDRQEQLIAARFRESTDWKRTRAFAIPALFTSYIRVNLQGREPEGIVQPGSEYTELLDAIERDFLALEVVGSDQPAVLQVRRPSDLNGGQAPYKLPDLIVVWRPRSQMMTHLQHPKGEIRVAPHPYARSTYHTYSGFLVARGPSSDSGDVVDIRSVAPWLEGLIGSDGSPLKNAS